MGFLESARDWVERAQRRLDESQRAYNESQRERCAVAEAPAERTVVHYDNLGRPLEAPDEAPTTESPAVSADAGTGR